MRRVWYNGIIDSMDEGMHRYEALGAEDGRIVFLGTSEDALKLDWDEMRDLKGAQMLPGFQDSHLHMLHYASFKKNVPLFGIPSIKEVIDCCKERVQQDHPEYLIAVGWNQDYLEEKRMLAREDLDLISEEIPVCAVRACLHIAICNTPMIELIRKMEGIPAEVEKDIDYEKGIIKENAARIYLEALPSYTDGEIREMVLSAQQELNACGITGIQSDDLHSLAGVDPIHLIGLFRQMEEAGELTVRIYEQCLVDQETFPKLLAVRSDPADRESLFRTGPRKILQDGSLGAKTAEMIEGYFDEPSYHGMANYTDEELYTFIRDAHLEKMDVAVHTIGDLALKKVCDTIERVNREKPWQENRHGVVHAQITNPQLLQQMKEQKIQAFIQPIFIDYDMNVIEDRVGSRRLKDCYIWKTMRDMGIHTSGGSDCPVEPFDILDNMRSAITRKNRAGTKSLLPEEALSAEEAVRLFTIDAVWACRDEEVRGTLELGKYADMVVLEKNLFDIPGEMFPDVTVLETVLNGKTVYALPESQDDLQ